MRFAPVPLVLVVLLALLPFSLGAAPAPAGTEIRTIYLDVSTLKEESEGMRMSSGVDGYVINTLNELGFDVLRYRGKRPSEAVYSISFQTFWKPRKKGSPYVDKFVVELQGRKQALGVVEYKGSADPQPGDHDIYEGVGKAVRALMANVTPKEDAAAAKRGKEVSEPQPTAMLPPLGHGEWMDLRDAIQALKLPATAADIEEKLGGKGRLHRIGVFTKTEQQRPVSALEYALTDTDQNYSYFLDLYVDGTARGDGSDLVRALQIFLQAPGTGRFIPAPDALIFLSKKSEISKLLDAAGH